jgi:hypothetical protein
VHLYNLQCDTWLTTLNRADLPDRGISLLSLPSLSRVASVSRLSGLLKEMRTRLEYTLSLHGMIRVAGQIDCLSNQGVAFHVFTITLSLVLCITTSALMKMMCPVD